MAKLRGSINEKLLSIKYDPSPSVNSLSTGWDTKVFVDQQHLQAFASGAPHSNSLNAIKRIEHKTLKRALVKTNSAPYYVAAYEAKHEQQMPISNSFSNGKKEFF